MTHAIRIGLIRHGVTDWNQEGRVQGATDIALNEEGVRQAHLLARRLRGEPWQAIYSSDLSRAHRTAAILADALKLPVQGTDERLRERAFGEAEGTTIEERLARWGTAWREQIEGIETNEDVLRRGTAALESIASRHPGGRILIVTHGGWIVTVLKGLLHESELPFIGNTSVSIIERRDDEWTPVLIGCQEHLNAGPE